MNRNTNLTLFNLMVLEMAIIAELLNNLTFVVVDVDETPNLNDYDDYDFPQPPTQEEVLTEWLEKDCGLTMGTSYAPNERMVALSVDEMMQIKREMDVLRVRAEEGEELAKKIQNIHDEFFS